jgi:hypothetical protein
VVRRRRGAGLSTGGVRRRRRDPGIHRVEKLIAEVVEARQVVLRDGEGVVRAALVVGGDSMPRLRLYDPTGALRVQLAVYGTDVPAIELLDRESTTRAELWLAADGTPALTLRDAHGDGRGELGLHPGGRPYFVVPGGAVKTSRGQRPAARAATRSRGRERR